MTYSFSAYQKKPLLRNHLHLGGVNPSGERIEVNSLYIERNAKPWIGIMGEFHFCRYNHKDWYQELCKIKAGGISIVSTYLFWIYHEEVEGQFDFTGDLDIRRFVLDAQRAGLEVCLRIGPWVHGECRNGGFPDWLLAKKYPLRQNHPDYLAQVRIWYEKIYEQVRDLFWEDGGNIIAVQLENELPDNAEHLLSLKQLACQIGFRVPLYTVTGWNSRYGARIPVDEVLPVFGGYVEAPWTDHIHKRPLSSQYVFNPHRNSTTVGNDLMQPVADDGWHLPYERYPFATCELGAGLQVTHHRRPVVSGMDAYAMALVKLGSGNNLPGYYMYHGGTHRIGYLSTLNESKASGYPNDYPIRSYDFHTALSEYGEVREQYGLLNLLHLFLHDFGELLAPMEYVPGEKVVQPDDLSSLRYCMRTDGRGGFVFVNHYQRLARLDDLSQVVIETPAVQLPPMDVCGDICFFLPFHIELEGNLLLYATSQLLCRVDNTYFFMAIPGIQPQYQFARTPHNIRIVTLSWEEARYARKLSGKLYIGEHCDLYEMGDGIHSVQDGSFSYRLWNGSGWSSYSVDCPFRPASVLWKTLKTEPFTPPYAEELELGGPRKRFWKKLTVDSPEGFVRIPGPYDAAQIYGDGHLIADQFYCGEPWHVPARLLFGKECYLVTSEMKDDFYHEFD